LIQSLANTVILKSCAEMSAVFINRTGKFLESHLKKAAVSEELGWCMDDVMMEVIPRTWPLVTQIFIVAKLFEGLYKLADNPVSAPILPLTLC